MNNPQTPPRTKSLSKAVDKVGKGAPDRKKPSTTSSASTRKPKDKGKPRSQDTTKNQDLNPKSRLDKLYTDLVINPAAKKRAEKTSRTPTKMNPQPTRAPAPSPASSDQSKGSNESLVKMNPRVCRSRLAKFGPK